MNRARRILPVLFCLLLVTLLMAFVFPPTFSSQVAESILYTLGFSSNIYFWLQSQVYGMTNGFGIPLLHTWSLSVEEQFYLIFQFFLFFA